MPALDRLVVWSDPGDESRLSTGAGEDWLRATMMAVIDVSAVFGEACGLGRCLDEIGDLDSESQDL